MKTASLWIVAGIGFVGGIYVAAHEPPSGSIGSVVSGIILAILCLAPLFWQKRQP